MKTSAVKRLIVKDVKTWRDCFDLSGWTIHVEWGPLDGLKVASTVADWGYREATLTFDARGLRGLGRDEIRSVVVHELVHLVCCGYQQHHRMEQLEAMVTNLTTIVDRCWKAQRPK